MDVPAMKDLLEAGVHFGHQVRRWHPSMKHFIFGARDGVHIIDLEKTEKFLLKACQFVKDVYANGGNIIFLGTKNQAKNIVKEAAEKCGGFWITERWIGGLITNFGEVSKNIKKLVDLEAKKENEEEMKKLTKKERIVIDRQIARLQRLYGGLKGMDKLPDALYVIDVKREETACREAKRKGIPVVAICDSNANLDLVDYPIPGNDDSIRAVSIITDTVVAAAQEGKEGSTVKEAAAEKETEKKEEKKKEVKTAAKKAPAAKKSAQTKKSIKAAKKASQKAKKKEDNG